MWPIMTTTETNRDLTIETIRGKGGRLGIRTHFWCEKYNKNEGGEDCPQDNQDIVTRFKIYHYNTINQYHNPVEMNNVTNLAI